jgi:hypothetical protein
MPPMSSALYENPDNPFGTIETPFGKMEAWRASTMATGSMGAFDTYMRQSRAEFEQLRSDSASLKDELTAWAAELTARENALEDRTREVTDFAGRAAQFYERTEELYNELRAEPLASPPG